LENASNPKFLAVDFEQDKPPMFLARGIIKLSPSYKILDIHALLTHLKTLLISIEPHE
jgi:hypothetical protein